MPEQTEDYVITFNVKFRLKVKANSESHAKQRALTILEHYGDRLFGLNTPDGVVRVKEIVGPNHGGLDPKTGEVIPSPDMEIRAWDA